MLKGSELIFSDTQLTVVASISFLLVLILTILFSTLLRLPKYSILDFEFCFDARRALLILNHWGEPAQQKARNGLYLDFLYIVAYTLLFFSVGLLMAHHLEWPLKTMGYSAPFLAFVAGGLDMIENLFLLSILKAARDQIIPDAMPFLAGCAASLKFLLIEILLLYFITGASLFLLRILI